LPIGPRLLAHRGKAGDGDALRTVNNSVELFLRHNGDGLTRHLLANLGGSPPQRGIEDVVR
jgi:hypothetical protein